MNPDRNVTDFTPDLVDSKILVTGASSGIGKRIATDLAALGAQVALVGRNTQAMKETIRSMNAPGRHRYYEFDLQQTEDAAALVREINADFGRLSGFVYSAGVEAIVPLRMLSYTRFDHAMRVNLYSFIEMVKAYAEKQAGNSGSIVGISSSAADLGGKGQTIYAATKAAMDAAIRCLAQELVDRDIRINTIQPGVILTEMTQKVQKRLGESFLAEQTAKQLLGLGKPEDISRFAIFLLSSLAGFCTGRTYQVDGGRLR